MAVLTPRAPAEWSTTLATLVTKVWGNHTLKFGGLWEYAGENNYDQISVDNTRPGTTNNQNGLFVFTDTRGGGADHQKQL